MNRLSRPVLTLLLALLPAGIVWAQPSEGPKIDPGPVYVPADVGLPETETGGTRRVPIYVPPQMGVPGGRVGVGTRGAADHPSLRLLAPDHVGLTTHAQPALYWYAEGPIATRVDVTLRDEESVEPLLDVQLPLPIEAGVNAVRLGEHGVTLRPDTNYQWFVSIVPESERRSKDRSVGAWIRRAEASAPLKRRLELSGAERAVFVYAESGIWYDAIEAASARIASGPTDPEPRAWRAALLEQVGLSEVARYDLAQGP